MRLWNARSLWQTAWHPNSRTHILFSGISSVIAQLSPTRNQISTPSASRGFLMRSEGWNGRYGCPVWTQACLFFNTRPIQRIISTKWSPCSVECYVSLPTRANEECLTQLVSMAPLFTILWRFITLGNLRKQPDLIRLYSIRSSKMLAQEENVLSTAAIMQRCLRLDPTMRVSAEELVRCCGLDEIATMNFAWSRNNTFREVTKKSKQKGTNTLQLST